MTIPTQLIAQLPSKKILATALASLMFSLVSCQSANQPSRDKPKVVSTSTILADLVTQVGGEKIEHKGILPPGADPHVYEPRPQDTIALEEADLIFYNGYNLEPAIIKLIKATGIRAIKSPVGEVVKPLNLTYQGQTQPDPHVWGDVENAIAMVEEIEKQLSQLSPQEREIFAANAAKLIEELEKLDNWIEKQIQTIPPARRKLVTTHDAFQYYAQAYGLEIIGTLIGISTEEQPSAQTVKNLTEAVKRAKVPAIFAETTINPQLITTVAKEAQVKLAPRQLYSDSLSAPGKEADTYIKMQQTNTQTIVEALSE